MGQVEEKMTSKFLAQANRKERKQSFLERVSSRPGEFEVPVGHPNGGVREAVECA